MSEPNIISFIFRFTQEQDVATAPATWRILVRHVQTREQIQCTHIEDALAFMSHYVDLPVAKPDEQEKNTP